MKWRWIGFKKLQDMSAESDKGSKQKQRFNITIFSAAAPLVSLPALAIIFFFILSIRRKIYINYIILICVYIWWKLKIVWYLYASLTKKTIYISKKKKKNPDIVNGMFCSVPWNTRIMLFFVYRVMRPVIESLSTISL